MFNSKLCREVLSLIEKRGGCSPETRRVAIKVSNNRKVIRSGVTAEEVCNKLGIVDAYEYTEDLKYQQWRNNRDWAAKGGSTR